MNLEKLLKDEALRRHEFPVVAGKVFLTHAAVCPLPRRVSEAMQQYLAAATGDDQEEVVSDRVRTETRELAAKLIGAHRDEIAFTGSTSMGLGLVASGLPWERGDNLVCYRDDYPANVYPWMNLSAQGVEVRFVEPAVYGRVTREDVEKLVDGRTKLVALASAHFVSGWRLDVEEIGKFLRSRGVLFCLDGIQTLGALRTKVEHVDFAAADAHKWLLGPLGTAILYVRREHFERLKPALVGWHNAMCPDFVAQADVKFWPDARRYEPGSTNLTGVIGLREGLAVLDAVGAEAIEKRVLELAGYGLELGRRAGFQVMGPEAEEGRSGIISFTSEEVDFQPLQSRLAQKGIVVSVRRRRDGRRCLRLSPHFYNRREELDRCFEAIREG